MLDGIVCVTHTTATVAMTAIVWTMQLVHYPVFRLVDRERFPEFERHHSASTSKIVVPLMILEASSATIMLLRPHELLPTAAATLGAFLILVIWISTFAIQVPYHRILERGYDTVAHRRLVRTNWIRTVAWTARLGFVLWGMAR